VVNALSATDATKEMIDDARTINRKIQGSRKGTTPAVIPPPPVSTPPNPIDSAVPNDKQISVSQLSYDSQADNFFKLLELIKTEPSYNPNETELQVGTLAALEQDMLNKNKAVADAIAAIDNSRIARDKILYQTKTGLYDVQLDVKKYVLSVFKAGSPEYKQISGIKFTKPR
jgi:hypothetical protein